MPHMMHGHIDGGNFSLKTYWKIFLVAVIAVTVAGEGLDLLEGLLTRQGKLKNGEEMVFEKKIHHGQ